MQHVNVPHYRKRSHGAVYIGNFIRDDMHFKMGLGGEQGDLTQAVQRSSGSTDQGLGGRPLGQMGEWRVWPLAAAPALHPATPDHLGPSPPRSQSELWLSGVGHSFPGKGVMDIVIKEEEPHKFTLKFHEV